MDSTQFAAWVLRHSFNLGTEDVAARRRPRKVEAVIDFLIQSNRTGAFHYRNGHARLIKAAYRLAYRTSEFNSCKTVRAARVAAGLPEVAE